VSMTKGSVAHWSAASGSLFAATLALIPILASFAPALINIREFNESFHLYTSWVRDPLLNAIAYASGHEVRWPYLVDVIIFWLAIFGAVNIFIHRQDGLFVWGHIRHNSCFIAPSNKWGQVTCTLPKFIVALVLSPIICAAAIVSSLRTGRTRLTMGFITIDPSEVAKLVVASMSLAIFVIVVGSWSASRL